MAQCTIQHLLAFQPCSQASSQHFVQELGSILELRRGGGGEGLSPPPPRLGSRLAWEEPGEEANECGVNYKGINRGSANGREGLPEEANGIGDRRKTTETETRSSLSTVCACRGHFPPKYELPRNPTNQIVALPVRAFAGIQPIRS